MAETSDTLEVAARRRAARSRRRRVRRARPRSSPTPPSTTRPTPTRQGFWAEQAASCSTGTSEWHTILEWDLPVREVVRRRQAQRRRTTASTATSTPATATRSRSTGRASPATPAPSPTRELLARGRRSSPTRSKALGVEKGDRVAIYLGMVPELPIAMLACARIGAAALRGVRRLPADSLRDRINDAEAKVLITGDGAWRRGQHRAAEGDRRRGGRRDAVDRAGARAAAHRARRRR